MRDRPTKFNDNPTEKDAWLDEIDEFAPEDRHFEAADCAELADELDLFRIQAEADDAFWDTIACTGTQSTRVRYVSTCLPATLSFAHQSRLAA